MKSPLALKNVVNFPTSILDLEYYQEKTTNKQNEFITDFWCIGTSGPLFL